MLLPLILVAYRPFDGTDADVAETGEIELEVGPLQLERETGKTQYIPGFVFNDGIAPGYELVVDVDYDHIALSDVLVKHVLREGKLQGKTGISLAVETGVLLPGVPAHDTEAGWSLALIASYRWELITLHLNGLVTYQRDRTLGGFGSLIAEGPAGWPVRPVVELLAGNGGETALGGAIWQATGRLAVDGGVVYERESSTNGAELRLGVTITL